MKTPKSKHQTPRRTQTVRFTAAEIAEIEKKAKKYAGRILAKGGDYFEALGDQEERLLMRALAQKSGIPMVDIQFMKLSRGYRWFVRDRRSKT